MKIKTHNHDYNLTLIARCGFKEKIDRDILERFSQKALPYFLRINGCKGKKIVFSGIRSISLKEYLKEPIGKFDLFFILAQFVRLVKSIEDNNLPLSYVSYMLGNCFLTENTQELQLVYIPVKSKKTRQLPNDFIEALIYTATPKDSGRYISDFVFFYRNQSGFKVRTIEKYIERIEPEVYQVLDGKKYYCYDEKSFAEDNPAVVAQNRIDAENDDTIPAEEEDTLIGADKTFLGESDDTILGPSIETEKTEYLPGQKIKIPYLKRVVNGEKIYLTKPRFRIGVKESEVDYVVKNNNTISRSHADFITETDKYFVFDLSSKNKTFVNDRVIPVQIKVQIHPNDIVRLSDEEFVFCV